MLDHHADRHSAFTSTRADRAELMLTLPAEDLHAATITAFGLLRAVRQWDICRVEASTSDDYDGPTGKSG